MCGGLYALESNITCNGSHNSSLRIGKSPTHAHSQIARGVAAIWTAVWSWFIGLLAWHSWELRAHLCRSHTYPYFYRRTTRDFIRIAETASHSSKSMACMGLSRFTASFGPPLSGSETGSIINSYCGNSTMALCSEETVDEFVISYPSKSRIQITHYVSLYYMVTGLTIVLLSCQLFLADLSYFFEELSSASDLFWNFTNVTERYIQTTLRLLPTSSEKVRRTWRSYRRSKCSNVHFKRLLLTQKILWKDHNTKYQMF